MFADLAGARRTAIHFGRALGPKSSGVRTRWSPLAPEKEQRPCLFPAHPSLPWLAGTKGEPRDVRIGSRRRPL